MSEGAPDHLARRERQVMDVLFSKKEATAREILEALPDPPSYSAVRALLATLLEKRLVSHEKRGRHYLYRPLQEPAKAKKTALSRLLSTFFDGRPEKLVASLLDPEDQNLSEEDITRIKSLLKES